MPNNDLLARPAPRYESPLVGIGHLLAAHRQPNDEFRIDDRAHLSLCVFRASPDDDILQATVAGVLGGAQPLNANMFSEAPHVRAMWLGPDEWMLASASWLPRDIEANLREALGAQSYSIVDVTSGYTSVRLSGRKVPLVLSRGCPLDLSSETFMAGRCAQSVYFKSPLIIASHGGAVYDLILRRSFAEYSMLMMLDALKPIQQANLYN